MSIKDLELLIEDWEQKWTSTFHARRELQTHSIWIHNRASAEVAAVGIAPDEALRRMRTETGKLMDKAHMADHLAKDAELELFSFLSRNPDLRRQAHALMRAPKERLAALNKRE